MNVRTDVIPGHVTRLDLPPREAGTYSIRCDVFCDDGHDEISATLIVADSHRTRIVATSGPSVPTMGGAGSNVSLPCPRGLRVLTAHERK
jgi:hypothetical protein